MKENKNVHSSFWANIFKQVTQETELEKFLLSMPTFSELSRSEVKTLLSIIHHRTFVPGEFIFHQGDPGIALYIIMNGKVKIEYTAENGDNIKLANFSNGDFFGELALVDGEKRSASAIAETETILAVIFKPDLDEFVEKFPKKGVKILKGISRTITTRLRNLNKEYLNIMTKN